MQQMWGAGAPRSGDGQEEATVCPGWGPGELVAVSQSLQALGEAG